MQRRFFLFIIFFLITLVWMSSCKNNNEALEDMSNYNGNVFHRNKYHPQVLLRFIL